MNPNSPDDEMMSEAYERMRLMLDSSPFCAHFWDEHQKIIDCNQAAVKMFNLSSKQEYIEKYFELTPEFQPDGSRSVDKAKMLIDRAYNEGYLRLEWVRQSLDGEPIPVELTLVRVKYRGRTLFAGYNRDLREYKKMIRELEAAQLTTSAVFESNPQINILFDSEFKVINCNPAAMNFFEFSTKNEMLAGAFERIKECIPLLQPDGRRSISLDTGLKAAVEKGYIKFDAEITLLNKPRSLIVEFKKIPYGGSFAIVCYLYDMTEIRMREKELIRVRKENELQLAKLDLMVKATKIGMWDMEVIQDNPLNLPNPVAWSDQFRRLLGFTDENDFPNLTGSFNNLLHPEDKVRNISSFEKHLLDKTGKTPYDIEIRLMKKNGEYGYYRASGETIRDKEGNPFRVAGALMDITETKNLINEAEKQRMKAEAANKAKSSFLSTMSHEIRTPMNAILGITEMMIQNEILTPGVKEAIAKINNSGDLLLGIINNILDISKIEAGKMEIIVAKYEIASLISDTVQLNVMHIGSKSIKFILSVDENTPESLFGDQLRIKQILNNLLSNAFKYTQSGTVRMSIFAEPISGKDNEVILVVKVGDTGQGMTQEQIARLYNEYARFNIETNRSTEGTGLGMSITQNLVYLMKGEIQIESKPEKGTLFTVRLPQGKASSGVLGKEISENLRNFKTSSRAQMKRVQISRESMPYGSVLIVDDVETNIYVGKGLLSPYKLKVDSAGSGFEAIEKVKQGSVYDIIFMDHMMPKMDGFEAVKIIRDMGYKHPIVALTANAVAGQAEMFLKKGFDDFISKPIDIRQLNATLNRLIRDKQPQGVVDDARKQEMNCTEQLNENTTQKTINPKIVEVFIRDAIKTIAALEILSVKKDYRNDNNMQTYIINMHGIKSALANIGRMDLASAASKLELAGREKRFELILPLTPSFISSLRALVDKLDSEKKAAESVSTAPGGSFDEDKAFLEEKLLAVKAACEQYDESTADDAIENLRKMNWPQETKKMLSAISEKLLHSDFEEIVNDIDNFLK